MKTLITLVLLLVMPLTALSKPSVALIISGYGNQGDTNLSYDLEELAQSYLILTDNDINIDIISPNGGAVPVHAHKDHLPHIQTFKSLASDSLSQTLSAKQALLKAYDAVMIIGGDGAMFDLPVHKDTQHFIKQFIQAKHPIAAVCHGPAALVNIRLDNGLHYVTNKRINSFTRVEDQAFKKEHIEHYPFILQTELEKKGANFVSNSPMLPFVTVDDNLITAQNPMSVAKATEALIMKLGKTPKQRELYKDEATFELAAQAKYQGPILIDIALKQNKQNYDLTYLALYGVYAYNLAETQEDKRLQLEIMAYIGKHFSHPQYHYALMKAYEEQGFDDKAKYQKQRLATDYPDFKLPDA